MNPIRSAPPPGARQGRLSAWLRSVMALLVLVMLLTACAGDQPTQTPEPVIDAAVTARPLPTKTALAAPTAQSTIVQQNLPTAEPQNPHTGERPFAQTPTSEPTSTAVSTATPTPRLKPGWVRVPAGPVQVPILMYHHISDKINTRYALPVATFRAQMAYLHEQGYQTVSVAELAAVIRAGGVLPEKAVVITFDDGYLDTYANAFPIMEEYGFTGTVYIITSTLEEGLTYGYMQKPELQALVKAGWEIGSHSVTHTNLKETKLGPGNEMRKSKAVLEKLLDVPVRTFSYPYAVSNDSLRQRAEESGYEAAVGVDILVTNTPRRLYYLSRLEVGRSLSLVQFQRLLVPGEDELAWLEASRTPDSPDTP